MTPGRNQMTEAAKSKYEFSEEENNQLSRLAGELARLGKIILLAGVLLIAYIVLSFVDPQSIIQLSDAKHMALAAVDYALWVFIALLVIYLSVTVIRLSKPVQLIVSTRGADISHLMSFVGELCSIARRSFSLLVIVCVLLFVSLGLMILVF
jgi:hypothetical protein